MSTDTLELVLKENPIFIDLAAKINAFKEAAQNYKPFEELQRLAEDISGYCRYIKETYQRGDSLPQFMEVVARAFEGKNLGYVRRHRNLRLIEEGILNALSTVDLTLVSVYGFVEKLKKQNIKADYL